MIDEYIYQFQNYQFSKFSKKPEAQPTTIAPEVWDIQAVINTLQKIITSSKVADHLTSSQFVFLFSFRMRNSTARYV